MYPILARFGPFLIYSYEIVLGVGIISCIALSAWLLKDGPARRDQWFNTALIGAILAILGGRIIFVLAHLDYYSEAPGEIWLVWRGGLSYHGALLSFLAAIWLWMRLRDRKVSDCAEVLALILPLLAAFGWLACLLDGCAFGRAADLGPLAADWPDSLGVYALRYQTQLMGLVMSAIIFVLVLNWRRRLDAVPLFWLSLALVSASRFIVDIYRGDEMIMIGAVRLDMLVDGLLAAAALAGLLLGTRNRASRMGAEEPDK